MTHEEISSPKTLLKKYVGTKKRKNTLGMLLAGLSHAWEYHTLNELKKNEFLNFTHKGTW